MRSVVALFFVLWGAHLGSAQQPWSPKQQDQPIRVLVVDASAEGSRCAERLQKMKFAVRVVAWDKADPEQTKDIDVIFLATGWGEPAALTTLDSKKGAFRKFIERGGGLIASQPNPVATKTCTPALLPYPVTFHYHYDDRDPTCNNLAQDHFITEDLPDKDMPFPHDRMIKLDPRYRVLAKQASTSSPSLAVATFGDGRVVVQTANENYAANIRLPDEILRRMFVWAAGKEPRGVAR